MIYEGSYKRGRKKKGFNQEEEWRAKWQQQVDSDEHPLERQPNSTQALQVPLAEPPEDVEDEQDPEYEPEDPGYEQDEPSQVEQDDENLDIESLDWDVLDIKKGIKVIEGYVTAVVNFWHHQKDIQLVKNETFPRSDLVKKLLKSARKAKTITGDRNFEDRGKGEALLSHYS